MITLFHGEDVVASRNALPKNSLIVDGKTATPESFTQLTQGNSLFDDQKTIILENPKNLPPEISNDVLIWFDHKLTPNQIKAFPKARIQEFKLDQIVFKFVESLRPGNQEEILALFEKYSRQEIPEIIFSMIIRQFRLMLNPNGLPNWQKHKIISQSRRFVPEQLKNHYRKLLTIDFEIKTGQAVLDLKGSLELFLLSL